MQTSIVVNSRVSAESGIRQLIENGKEKTALDRAKDLHKTYHDAASESLLLDAYLARIQALSRQNLHLEAKALLDLVKERYPAAAAARLAEAADSAAARSGEFDQILRALADATLPADRRASIERLIEENVFDLAVIAQSNELAQDHPLRQAAAALERAFVAVTSGPVSEESIALPEVSRRSPLADWKLLIRAIACFYRKEDDACRQCLDTMKPSSAPARIVPVIRQMLDDKAGQPLAGAAAGLITAVGGGHEVLKRSFEHLDAAFDDMSNPRRVLDSIRAAIRECDVHAPDLSLRLKQLIAVLCAINDLGTKPVMSVIGDTRADAYSLRLMASGLEATGDLDRIPVACGVWDQFRMAAIAEGWFPAKGVEVATLYLHMASLLSKLPAEALDGLVKENIRKGKAGFQDLYFLQPQELYERACEIDPHSEAFAQWMRWAKGVNFTMAGTVAREWHKVLPDDLDPVLYLMRASESLGNFQNALQHLAAAERIDSLHAEVRNARFRLLSRHAMHQIQQKKPFQAERTLEAMAELPQAKQGDWPALLVALRSIARAVAGDHARAAFHRHELESLLGSRAAASLLLAAVASECRRGSLEKLIPAGKLDAQERAALPLILARVGALLREIKSPGNIPAPWVAEALRQFGRVREQLDTSQLRELANIAQGAENDVFIYAISVEGLARGGATEAEFLLMRAMSLRDEDATRTAFCAAAAAELARNARNMDLVSEAIEFLRDEDDSEGPPLTLEQANEVLRKEKQAENFPTKNEPGPDHGNLLPCDCPNCRRARGEEVEDDQFDEDAFGGLPPDIPPKIAEMLLEEALDSIKRGESPKEFLDRMLRDGPPSPHGKKKRKRKR